VSSGECGKRELWVMTRARGLGFSRNPLRRRVDRIESVVLLVAVLVGLLMIPAAIVLGFVVRDEIEQSAAERRATLTETPARTLTDSEALVGAVPGQVMSHVQVAWTDATGAEREGWAYVLLGTKQGAEVTIWLDRSGAIAPTPRPPGDGAPVGAAVGFTAGTFGLLLVSGLTRLAVASLDRRRARDLELEWEQADDRWRHHQN
jgi:hypothetical protein